MINIFKADPEGPYKTESGITYDCKSVQSLTKAPKGWSRSLDKAIGKSVQPKESPEAAPAQEAVANEPAA